MALTLESLMVELGLDAKDFESGVKHSERAIGRFADKLDELGTDRAQKEMTSLALLIGSAGESAELNAKQVAFLTEEVVRLRESGAEVPPVLQAFAAAGDEAAAEANRLKEEVEQLAAKTAIMNKAWDLAVGAMRDAGQWMQGVVGGALDSADALSNLGLQTGMSTKALQEFNYIGAGVGVTAGEIGTAMRRLQSSIAGGGDEVVTLMNKLQLSMSELRTQAPEVQFERILKAIDALPTPAERSAAAVKLLGRAGTMILPLAKDFDVLRARAHDVGAVLGDDVVRAVDDAGDAMDRLGVTTSKLKDAIGSAFVGHPVVKAVIVEVEDAVGSLAAAVARASEPWKTLGAVAGGTLLGVGFALDKVIPTVGTFGTIFSSLVDLKIISGIDGLVKGITALAVALGKVGLASGVFLLVYEGVKKLVDSIPGLRSEIDKLAERVVSPPAGGRSSLSWLFGERGGGSPFAPRPGELFGAQVQGAMAGPAGTAGLPKKPFVPEMTDDQKKQLAESWKRTMKIMGERAADAAEEAFKHGEAVNAIRKGFLEAFKGDAMTGAIVFGLTNKLPGLAKPTPESLVAGERQRRIMESGGFEAVRRQIRETGFKGAVPTEASAALSLLATQQAKVSSSTKTTTGSLQALADTMTALGPLTKGFTGKIAGVISGIGALVENLGKAGVGGGGKLGALLGKVGPWAAVATAGIGLIGGIIGLFKKKPKEEKPEKSVDEMFRDLQEMGAGGVAIAQARARGAPLTKDMKAQVDAGLSLAAQGLEQFAKAGGASADIFLATMHATLKEKGLAATIEAMKPTFDLMGEAFKAAGDEASLAMLAPFLRLSELMEVEGFRAATEQAEGLAKVIKGMSDAGYISVALFQTLGAQVQATFTQAIASGANTREALFAIAPALQELWQTSRTYGVALDENTMSMIRQAQEAGIAFKTDPMERMVEILEAIAAKMGAIVSTTRAAGDAFGYMGDEASRANDRVGGGPAGFWEGPGGDFSDVDRPVPVGAQHGFYSPSMPYGPLAQGATPMVVHPGEEVSVAPRGARGGAGRGEGGELTAIINMQFPFGEMVRVIEKAQIANKLRTLPQSVREYGY